jgi:hypothetical protein
MVNIMLAVAGFLAFFTIIEACGGWYQCKYSDGSHCCVRSQKYSYLMRIITTFHRWSKLHWAVAIAQITAMAAMHGRQSVLAKLLATGADCILLS